MLTLDAENDAIESDDGEEQMFIDLSERGGLNGKVGTDMKNILGYLN